ncbi:DivIVA domain-containing protein, partial [bacterium]|nr:DivIVA domain-containing protein [bacterium]
RRGLRETIFMPLTPLDIESQHFKREVLGYSRREVDAALRSAADALSQVNLDREELQRMMQATRAEVDEYRRREKTLIESLAAAERLTEERKALAQAEAEKLMADTRTQCEQLLQRTRAEVTRIEQQILRLKVERETFENKLLALLEEHRRLVELRRQESGIADKMRRGPSTGPQGPDGRD